MILKSAITADKQYVDKQNYQNFNFDRGTLSVVEAKIRNYRFFCVLRRREKQLTQRCSNKDAKESLE